MVQHDGAANGDSRFVLEELLECLRMILDGKGSEERAMLKNSQTKSPQRHRRQGRVQWPNEIFIKPLRFLDLKAYSGNRRQVFLWEVDDEADAKIVQPCG